MSAVVLCAALFLALFTFASEPVSAQTAPGGSTCPVLELANPQPGSELLSGAYVVSGLSLDPLAPNGQVSKIDFFFGSRDSGGAFLGSFVPPAGSTQHSFQTTIKLPDVDRKESLVAYAYSGLSSATTTVEVPIEVGSVPASDAGSTTTAPATVTVKAACPTAVTLTPGSGVSVAAAPAPVVSVMTGQGPRLVVGNPNANDIVLRGKYMTSGVAFDPASTDGPGIDRVQFFIGARDNGGLFLGSITPGVAGAVVGPRGAYMGAVSIPKNLGGNADFMVYARSALSGKETVVSVPVVIGALP